MLALWLSTKLNHNLIENIRNSDMGFKYNLIDTIQSIENKDWNQAKSIWILKVLNLKPNCACLCEDSECEDSDCKPSCDCAYNSQCDMKLNKQISTYGSEYEFFLEPCNRFQTYIINLSCSPCCAFNNHQKNSVSLSFIKKNSIRIIRIYSPRKL